MSLKLDLNRTDLVHIHGATADNARYVQDGIRYDAAGEVIGDKAKIAADLHKARLAAAESELNKRRQELLDMEKELGIEPEVEAPKDPEVEAPKDPVVEVPAPEVKAPVTPKPKAAKPKVVKAAPTA